MVKRFWKDDVEEISWMTVNNIVYMVWNYSNNTNGRRYMKYLPIDRNKCPWQERDELDKYISKSYFKCSNECGFFGFDNNPGIQPFDFVNIVWSIQVMLMFLSVFFYAQMSHFRCCGIIDPPLRKIGTIVFIGLFFSLQPIKTTVTFIPWKIKGINSRKTYLL